MTKSKVILLGMPGSGKSTFGRRLTKALGFHFIDLDDTIEEMAGRTIPELFAISETHFRQQETKALQQVLKDKRPLVIALGGGTPCFNDNMSEIRKEGLSIFLDPPMSVLVSRTEKEGHRPLLQGRSIPDRVAELYENRAKYYAQADVRLTTPDPDPMDVIKLMSSL